MKLKQRLKGLLGWNRDLEQGGSIPPWFPAEYWQRDMKPYGGGQTAAGFACASIEGKTFSLAAPTHVRVEADGSHTVLKNTAITRLFRKPNSYQNMADVQMDIGYEYITSGNVVYLMIRNNRNEVVAIHPVRWKSAQPMIIPDTKEVYYSIGNNPLIPEGIDMLVPQRDIIHIRAHCPEHPLMGVSPLEYAAMSSGVNVAILSNQSNFFANMSRPSGILSTDQVLTRDQIIQLRGAWEAQSADVNSGKVPVLGGGLKWQGMSANSNDSQIIDALKWSIHDIARVCGVPLPLIGETEGSSYNSVEQLIQLYLMTGLGQLIELCEQTLTRAFGMSANEKVEFDVAPLLKTDMATRVESTAKFVQSGIYTVNEARQRERLPEVEGGDEPFLQRQMVPISVAVKPPEPAPVVAPVPAAEEPDKPTEEETEAKHMADVIYLKKRIANG